jgi:UDP-4-amino-4,6-dideoxy-N-acetyl-beta-L-altrosamine N-acetyltransferase
LNGFLRPMRESDLEQVLRWRNAPETRKNMYTFHEISPEEHRNWWQKQQASPTVRQLVYELDGEPAGVVNFTNYTGPGGSAMWAFYSGDTSRRGLGHGMEMAALHYAFDELRLRRLECEVLSFNRSVVDFHLRHGFTLEGTFRQAYQRDGETHDIHRLSLLEGEWRAHVEPHFATDVDGNSARRAPPHRFAVDTSATTVDAYAAATGDANPIHLDDAFARSAGFRGRIMHGMLIGGALSRYFASEYPGPGTIYVSQSLEFRAPVFVDEPAEAILEVVSQIGRRLRLDVRVEQAGRVCATGQAVLVVPKSGVER